MTRVLVVSDSHGYYTYIEMMLERHKDIQNVFHLGDGVGEADMLRHRSGKTAYCVRGNCDGMSPDPAELVLTMDGVTMLLCHGHSRGVKSGPERLSYFAEEQGATVALYGHTHVQKAERVGGVLTVNPGTARRGEYAILTLENGRAEAELRRV